MTLVVEDAIRIPMRDGIELVADVYRPQGASRIPTLVQRTPYGRRGTTASYAVEPIRAARSGFAFVIVDVRGRFASEGDFSPFDSGEQDLSDLLDWLAEQPWAGPVGLVGGSYGGTLQWLGIRSEVDRIGSICPFMCSPDFSSWTYREGILQHGFLTQWSLANLVEVETPEQRRALVALASESLASPPPESLRSQIEQAVPWLAEWVAVPPAASRPVDSVPALVISGWFDIFKDAALDGFTDVAARNPGRHALIVGPWSHSNSTGYFAERSFGQAASAAAVDVVGRQLEWSKAHLAKEAEKLMPSVLIYMMGMDEWHSSASWPVETKDFVLPISDNADGPKLAPERTSTDQTSRVAHDASDPVRTVGGAVFLPGNRIALNAGPMKQSLDSEENRVVYIGDPLAEPLDVVGSVNLALYVSATLTEIDLVATLLDIHPDGTAYNLTTGSRRIKTSHADTDPREAEISLGWTANRFLEGHRVGLAIAGADFPASASRADSFEVTIYHEPQRPSRLVLPVADMSTMKRYESENGYGD